MQAVAGSSAAAGVSSLTTDAHATVSDRTYHNGDSVAADDPVDPELARFTVAVMPDTQYLFDQGGSDPEPVRAALRHLVRRRAEDDIVFLAHLGDVTENYGNDEEVGRAGERSGSSTAACPTASWPGTTTSTRRRTIVEDRPCSRGPSDPSGSDVTPSTLR